MGCSASNVRTVDKSSDDRILTHSLKSNIVIIGEATERVDQTDLIQKQEMIGEEFINSRSRSRSRSKSKSNNKHNSIEGNHNKSL
jgi:hypothetical protein